MLAAGRRGVSVKTAAVTVLADSPWSPCLPQVRAVSALLARSGAASEVTPPSRNETVIDFFSGTDRRGPQGPREAEFGPKFRIFQVRVTAHRLRTWRLLGPFALDPPFPSIAG